MQSFAINGREIGLEQTPYVIAEISGNHLGRKDRAMALIRAAKEAGADAVKLQTYTADTITLNHDGPEFRIHGGLWDGRLLYDLYREAHTPWDWHPELFALARSLGITIFSSPFDHSAIDYLADLGVPAFKIASFEAIDLPLITYAAAKGCPLIISTGMCDLGDITAAVGAAQNGGCPNIALLHCVSGYPAPVEESNLRTIPHLATAFGVPVGLSDHTLGIGVPVAAAAMGATVIEKHLTLARADGGPDGSFSLEPDEFAAMVRCLRDAHAALGMVTYQREPSEAGNVQFRRSLYAVLDIAQGEEFTNSNVRSIRPGFGLAPKYLPAVLGCRAARRIRRGEALAWPMIANDPST